MIYDLCVVYTPINHKDHQSTIKKAGLESKIINH